MKKTSVKAHPAAAPTRPVVQLSTKVDSHLRAYSAAAAGVGVFALAHPAEAKVVFTPSNISISANAGLVQLDLNRDGIPDFAFSVSFRADGANHRNPPVGQYAASLLVIPTQIGNEVGAAASSDGLPCAAKLRGKVEIAEGKHFRPDPLFMFQIAGDFTNQFSAHCPWANRIGGFLAFKFMIDGQTHYGWARIAEFGTKFAAIRGYAYETDAEQPITTGITESPDNADLSPSPIRPAARFAEQASLGLLAGGALGLDLWRRPEEVV